ncbi:MAG TPA: MmcQ/YjbR family DNA-binding protein [Gaiellaceae bacterium]|nr:MmcQ/YjbR family DNA-binding protein [Gaiellaceae bacterium]
MADWETVREISGSFPGAEESTTYGKPAFKVAGKLFAWLSPDRAAEGALAVRVDPDEKEHILAADPATFQTAHYEGHPIVLIDLDRVTRRRLEERIEDSWLLRAPKRLVDAYVTERG